MSIYKSRLTGHWIVDEFGTKRSPGGSYRRQGFRKYSDAVAHAIELIDSRSSALN